jgi:membrane-bound lytic murein transglycosylase D
MDEVGVNLRSGWLGVCLLLLSSAAAAQTPEFPRPAELEPDIAFWTRVYTEIDTSSGFIHDSENLAVVYQTVSFLEGTTGRERNRQLRSIYEDIREALAHLADGKRSGLSATERRVLEAWPAGVSNNELRRAGDRLRFQLGQSDRFRSGLIRAGTWKPYIERVLEQRGLPRELAALPHVESSFDPTAYSKVGAAGMWQFTRSTGLRYMRIDHIVDERRDPYFSTVAAARLLQSNFDVLGTWPLALTAYNHGVAGMRRAVQQQKTQNIETILRNYSGRTFGFASRNFYVAFLAAVDVDRDAERFFGPLTPDVPANSITVAVPDFVRVDALEASLDIDRRRLRYWNPALTEAVWSGDKLVPKGFELRLPAVLDADPALRLAAIPTGDRFAAQMPDIFHRVGRGDTISQIAQRYGVSMAALVELNGLRSRNFIRAGQVLRLPGNGDGMPVSLAELDGSSEDVSTYVVRSGDSIARIARRFGVSETTLLAQNGISDRNRIFAGQELLIRSDADSEPELALGALPGQTSLIAALPGATAVVAPTAAATVDDRTAASTLSRTDEQRLLIAEARLAMLTDTSAEESEIDEFDAAGGGDVFATGDLDVDRVAVEDPAQDAPVAAEEVAEDNVLASEQAEMAADPSDYLVAADGTIEVQALETLGHYADWLQIRTQRLRDLNGLPFGQAVVIGERLKLDFANIDAATFEQRRVAYQQQTQEAFFLAYQVTDTVEHVIRPGESLWVLALRRYRVPVWLVRQFNPDLDLDQVNPGTVVNFPELRPIAAAETATQAATTH